MSPLMTATTILPFLILLFPEQFQLSLPVSRFSAVSMSSLACPVRVFFEAMQNINDSHHLGQVHDAVPSLSSWSLSSKTPAPTEGIGRTSQTTGSPFCSRLRLKPKVSFTGKGKDESNV